jgi:chromosome segregation ATPase
MTRASKAFVVCVVATLGLWGCAQGPVASKASTEKVKALESRCHKLEDECKQTAAARDQVKKKLVEVEEQRQKALKEVEQKRVLIKERDELKGQLEQRTNERDAMQNQFESFRQGLRTLLKDVDAAASTMPTVPSISVLPLPPPEKS